MGIIGRHSFELCSRPRIISSASYVGDKEGKGPLRECFDKICRDDTLGLDSWEQAESRMFESAVRVALAKIKRQSDDLSCLLGRGFAESDNLLRLCGAGDPCAVPSAYGA